MRTISQAPKPKPALAGGIEGAGHRVPDQQEPRQRQYTAVEDEQHVAEHGAAARADIAEKGQHVPRRPVGSRQTGPGRWSVPPPVPPAAAPRYPVADKYGSSEQDQKADTGKGRRFFRSNRNLFRF